MASSTRSSGQPLGPSMNKFIIALFLVKSKPTSVKIRDYLEHLQNFVRRGQRQDNHERSDRHVDTVAFWKDANAKSEEAQSLLGRRLGELEQQLERHGIPATETASQPKSQKRKRNEHKPEENSNGRARKQARTNEHSTDSQFQGFSLDEIAPGLEALGGNEDDFLQDLFALQSAVSRSEIQPKQLHTLLLQVLLSMRSSITCIASSTQDLGSITSRARKAATRTQERTNALHQANLEAETEAKLTAIARAFPLVAEALHKLSQTPEMKSSQGQVIYNTVVLFQKLLEQIHFASANQVQQRCTVAPNMKRPRGRLEKQIADHLSTPLPIAPSETPETGKMAKLLRQTAIAMMSALDPSHALDNEILEGILFFLLTRAGNLLSDFVFEPEKENRKSLGKKPTKSENINIRETEAPHIIHLIRHAIGLAAPRPQSTTPVHCLGQNPAALLLHRFDGGSHHSIAVDARLKLQNTMLKGVFGDDSKGIGAGLQRPLGQEMELCRRDGDKGEIKDVRYWFTSQLWQLVGWDVLREAVAWK